MGTRKILDKKEIFWALKLFWTKKSKFWPKNNYAQKLASYNFFENSFMKNKVLWKKKFFLWKIKFYGKKKFFVWKIKFYGKKFFLWKNKSIEKKIFLWKKVFSMEK